jgi:curved DNA-binding protein CbpA
MPNRLPSRAPDQDYYALIGVPATASQQQITRAYHRLARTTHPDADPRNAQAADQFRALADAYRVLSDPASRAGYDRTRQAGREHQPTSLAATQPPITRLRPQRPRPTGATVQPGPVIWTRPTQAGPAEDRP